MLGVTSIKLYMALLFYQTSSIYLKYEFLFGTEFRNHTLGTPSADPVEGQVDLINQPLNVSKTRFY